MGEIRWVAGGGKGHERGREDILQEKCGLGLLVLEGEESERG